jgi:hypothetical protein
LEDGESGMMRSFITSLLVKYNYSDEVKDDDMGRARSMHEKTNAYRVLVGKPEGKRPLERPRHRWEDNTKMSLRENYGVAWTGLIWLRMGTRGGLL